MAKVFSLSDQDRSPVETISISNSNIQSRLGASFKEEPIKLPILVKEHEDHQLNTQKGAQALAIEDQKEDGNEQHDSRPVTENSLSTIRNILPSEETTQDKFDTALDAEKALHEEKARKRKGWFQNIILNKPMEFSWPQLLFYTIGTTFLGVLWTIPLTMVPVHDIIRFPEYWYEILFSGGYAMIWVCVFTSFTSGFFLNVRYTQTAMNVFKACLVVFVTVCFFLIVTYYVWTNILAYQYPIPFLGFITTYTFVLFSFGVNWFSFPREWRKDKDFQKRMLYLFCTSNAILVCTTSYNLINQELVAKYQNQYQPIVALVLPINREAFVWICRKLIERSASGDLNGAAIALKYQLAVVHTITLCIMVGSSATNATSWVLMAVDFSINIFITLKIVHLKKRRPHMIEDQIELLEDLTINELVEFQMPLAFLLTLLLGYFGPNCGLFGILCNSYWDYEAIGDINETITNIMFFFSIDFISTVVSVIILWYSCKINLLNAFIQLQKEFATGFIALFGYWLVIVSDLIEFK